MRGPDQISLRVLQRESGYALQKRRTWCDADNMMCNKGGSGAPFPTARYFPSLTHQTDLIEQRKLTTSLDSTASILSSSQSSTPGARFGVRRVPGCSCRKMRTQQRAFLFAVYSRRRLCCHSRYRAVVFGLPGTRDNARAHW